VSLAFHFRTYSSARWRFGVSLTSASFFCSVSLSRQISLYSLSSSFNLRSSSSRSLGSCACLRMKINLGTKTRAMDRKQQKMLASDMKTKAAFCWSPIP